MDSAGDQRIRDMDTEELLQAQALVFHDVLSLAGPMAMKCAVELGIPDAIHSFGGRPVTISELSEALPELHPSKVPFLPRLMRLLLQIGFFGSQNTACGSQGYVLSPRSRLLVKGDPLSMAGYLLGLLHPFAANPWHHLAGWFKGPEHSAFAAANGKSVWEYLSDNPDMSSIFNTAMESESALAMDLIIRCCRDAFEGIGSLVDVGGGTGATARAIASAFPGVKCTVFDLPYVVAAAPEGGGEVTVVGGDMFEHVPSADAVLLKRVLHDWNDEDCVKILKQCKEAIPPTTGKVIILEIIINLDGHNDPNIKEAQLFFDMLMMLSCTAMERDESQWGSIFTAAGFSSYKVKHVLGMRSLIEVYP